MDEKTYLQFVAILKIPLESQKCNSAWEGRVM